MPKARRFYVITPSLYNVVQPTLTVDGNTFDRDFHFPHWDMAPSSGISAARLSNSTLGIGDPPRLRRSQVMIEEIISDARRRNLSTHEMHPSGMCCRLWAVR